jgi:hypothetical protein
MRSIPNGQLSILPWMSNEIKGKMVIPLVICIYITLHFQESSWINFFIPHFLDLIKLGDPFHSPKGWLPI